MDLSRRRAPPRSDFGQTTAIAALGFLAAEPERLDRFLSITGLGPQNLREAAADPGFFVSVLDYLAGDEKLLVSFAAEQGFAPEAVLRARDSLGGAPPAEP
jgi:hypothetical protein